MFVFTRNVFLYAFENDFYSAAHSHNARFVPLWPAGHGSRSGGKRSTLVPCSVTPAQTDVTDALERTTESPRGRSARCGALITAHAHAISWRARGHCLNRMEGKLGERESSLGERPGSYSVQYNAVGRCGHMQQSMHAHVSRRPPWGATRPR